MTAILREQKTTFFPNDSSSTVFRDRCALDSWVTSSPSAYIDRTLDHIAWTVVSRTPPAYEWVVPSSYTSMYCAPAEIMKVLLTAADLEFETSLEKAESAVRGVLLNVYSLDNGGFGRLAAQEVMLFVEKSLKRNSLNEPNRLLAMADISKLSSRTLIGLIRSTSRLKDRLPAWKIAYRKSREAVTKLGKNPDSLFVGLPKLEESDASKITR